MLVGTIVGLFLTPVLYLVVQRMAEKFGGGAKPAVAEAAPDPADD